MATSDEGDFSAYDHVWSEIKEEIKFYFKSNLSAVEPVNTDSLCAKVQQYCMGESRTESGQILQNIPSFDANLLQQARKNLYGRIRNFLNDYVNTLAGEVDALKGKEFLLFYKQQYNQYVQSSKVLDVACYFLNCSYLPQEQIHGGRDTLTIGMLALRVWEETFLVYHFQNKVKKTVLNLQLRQGLRESKSNTYDKLLFFEVLMAIGLIEEDDDDD